MDASRNIKKSQVMLVMNMLLTLVLKIIRNKKTRSTFLTLFIIRYHIYLIAKEEQNEKFINLNRLRVEGSIREVDAPKQLTKPAIHGRTKLVSYSIFQPILLTKNLYLSDILLNLSIQFILAKERIHNKPI